MKPSKRQLVFLWLLIPCLLPFLVALTYTLSPMKILSAYSVSVQGEYSPAYIKVRLTQLASQTIRVVQPPVQLKPAIKPIQWVFKQEVQAPMSKRPRVALQKRKQARQQKKAPKEKLNIKTDPFLTEWRTGQRINYNIKTAEYVRYGILTGEVKWPHDDRIAAIEVSFFDQVGPNGLDVATSTAIASQTLYKGSAHFRLQLPVESSGYLVAKAYSTSEPTPAEEPLYVGISEKAPLFISKHGVAPVLIEFYSYEAYLDEIESRFIGRVVNEYDTTACLSGVKVWVVETKEYVMSNENCLFEFRGLVVGKSYRLVLEKESFVPRLVTIHMSEDQPPKDFELSPKSMFTAGYNLFLGSRDPQKAVVFLTALDGSSPLSRIIVRHDSAESISYVRSMGEIEVPDATLYSTTESGKVILWNLPSGDNDIQLFYNGREMGRLRLKLFPGIVHYVTVGL